MNDQESTVSAVRNVEMPRRAFLRNSLMAIPVVSSVPALPLTASAAYLPPSRQRGTAVLNVRNYGAFGDGVHDDTAAIQKAINSLPVDGGTVFVPAGTYLIDAVTSIKLRSLMHLQLDPGAKLVAKPTSSDNYAVVPADVVSDVEVSGGQIIGERDHTWAPRAKAVTASASAVRSGVTIRDIRISKGWGDGLWSVLGRTTKAHYTYSQDVVVANVVCTPNRRNGLSIGNVIG